MRPAGRGGLLVAGLVVSLLLAGVGSGFASGSPDGLEHTARQGCPVGADGEIVGGSCMAQAERAHDRAGGVFAGYRIPGLADRLATGLSGVVGVLVTFGLGAGLFWLIRRRGPAAREPAARD
jgi:cobalt/nickel transport protein